MNWRTVARLLVGTALLTAGCLSSPTGPGGTPTPTPEPATKSDANLSSSLQQLLAAENRTRYARTHNITVEDGAVQVVIVLTDGDASPPEELLRRVDTRHDELVQAWVTYENLRAVANASSVARVRLPVEATTAGRSEA